MAAADPNRTVAYSMSEKTTYTNLLVLFAGVVLVFLFSGVVILQSSKLDVVQEAPSIALPTGDVMEHVAYEPYGPPWHEITLNGVDSTEDELHALVDKYMQHSSPDNVDYEELQDGKIIVIRIFWREHPDQLLASFQITKERAGLGTGYSCWIYGCIA